MKMRFFTVPVRGDPRAEEELNSFLSRHRILSLETRFIEDGWNGAWAIRVNYLDASTLEAAPFSSRTVRDRTDYREILSPEDFETFAKLRVLRKEISTRDTLPAYAVFTNEQLAEMVKTKADSLAKLGAIAGIGEAKSRKYGEAFVQIVKAAQPFAADGSGASTG